MERPGKPDSGKKQRFLPVYRLPVSLFAGTDSAIIGTHVPPSRSCPVFRSSGIVRAGCAGRSLARRRCPARPAGCRAGGGRGRVSGYRRRSHRCVADRHTDVSVELGAVGGTGEQCGAPVCRQRRAAVTTHCRRLRRSAPDGRQCHGRRACAQPAGHHPDRVAGGRAGRHRGRDAVSSAPGWWLVLVSRCPPSSHILR